MPASLKKIGEQLKEDEKNVKRSQIEKDVKRSQIDLMLKEEEKDLTTSNELLIKSSSVDENKFYGIFEEIFLPFPA